MQLFKYCVMKKKKNNPLYVFKNICYVYSLGAKSKFMWYVQLVISGIINLKRI